MLKHCWGKTDNGFRLLIAIGIVAENHNDSDDGAQENTSDAEIDGMFIFFIYQIGWRGLYYHREFMVRGHARLSFLQYQLILLRVDLKNKVF